MYTVYGGTIILRLKLNIFYLAMEVNRHFLENEYGDLSFFFCSFELRRKFLYVK